MPTFSNIINGTYLVPMGNANAVLLDPMLVRRLMALIDALADSDELKGRENDHFSTSDDPETVSSP